MAAVASPASGYPPASKQKKKCRSHRQPRGRAAARTLLEAKPLDVNDAGVIAAFQEAFASNRTVAVFDGKRLLLVVNRMALSPAQAQELGRKNFDLAKAAEAFPGRRASDAPGGSTPGRFGVRVPFGNTSRRPEAAVAGHYPHLYDHPGLSVAADEVAKQELDAVRSAGPAFEAFLRGIELSVIKHAGKGKPHANVALMAGTCCTNKAVSISPDFYNLPHTDKGDSWASVLIWYQIGSGALEGGEFVLQGLGRHNVTLSFKPANGTAIIFESAKLMHHTERVKSCANKQRFQVGTALFAKQATITAAMAVYSRGQVAAMHAKYGQGSSSSSAAANAASSSNAAQTS